MRASGVETFVTMTRGAKVFVRALLVVLVVALSFGAAVRSARPAHACSCAAQTLDEAYARADAVFVGSLVETRVESGERFSSMDPEWFVFEVDAVYKGDVRARQAVVTARDGASCGLEIAGPGPFLVFAYAGGLGGAPPRAEGELSSSLCSGTGPLMSRTVPSSFGAAMPPREGTASATPTPEAPVRSGATSDAPIALLLAGGVAVVLGLGAVALRMRRAR